MISFKRMMTDLKLFYRKVKKILLASMWGFFSDDCYTKSSTLTFYTTQAIVPFLAFLLGMAKGFGYDQYLQNLILNSFEEQKEVVTYSISIAQSMLKYIKESVVIGFGVLLLLWAMINLLGYIELVLNQIWKIKEQRSLFRKLSDYVAIVIICPLILIVSGSFTVYLKAVIAHLHGSLLIETIGIYLLLFLNFAPWILSWLLFFLLYSLMPNAKLGIWPLAVSSLFAGIFFQMWQLLYITLQIKIFNYNVVYGSFSVLPLLLIWLQVSWMIALAGAELAAHIENVTFDEEESEAGIRVTIGRKQLGLMILLLCLESFYSGQKPLTEVQITKALKIPLNITKHLLDILIKGEILTMVQLKNGSLGYPPFCDPGLLSIKQVCDIIDKSNDIEISIVITDDLKLLLDLLKQIDNAEMHSEANLRLSDLYFKRQPSSVKNNTGNLPSLS